MKKFLMYMSLVCAVLSPPLVIVNLFMQGSLFDALLNTALGFLHWNNFKRLKAGPKDET